MQGVAFPILGQHQAPEVRVIGEAHADEVVLLTLLPVGADEEIDQSAKLLVEAQAHAPDGDVGACRRAAQTRRHFVVTRELSASAAPLTAGMWVAATKP